MLIAIGAVDLDFADAGGALARANWRLDHIATEMAPSHDRGDQRQTTGKSKRAGRSGEARITLKNLEVRTTAR